MTHARRTALSLVACLLLAGFLAWLGAASPPPAAGLGPALLFGALMVFTTTFGLPAGGGWVSLMPMTAVAAFLVLGLAPAAWTVFVASLLPPFVQHVFAERLGVQPQPGRLGPLGLAAANAFINTTALLVSGALYLRLGGEIPLTTTALWRVPQLTVLSVTYLAANYLLAGAYIRARGREALRDFWRSLPRVAVYEGLPLVFASLVAVIYTQLGPAEFGRFSLLLIASALLVRSLGLARLRLERRVREMDSLQSVGQAFSGSLDLNTILETAYIAVARLMPTKLFYVALHDPETGEISYPLVVQDDNRVAWKPRRAGNGLVEHLLQTQEPLLLRRDVAQAAARLGLEPVEPPAASWLGAPLISGGEALGILAVQSASPGTLYDDMHRDLLAAIAAQAALVIRNARLYARTDQALARRVQELSSILQTTGEGLLLLDQGLNVLAANRALAGFLGLELGDIAGDVRVRRLHGRPPLLELIGYTEAGFQADCQALLDGGASSRKEQVALPGPPEQYVARTLAPVRGRRGNVVGWLLVFHDLTEERALAQMRDEWAHMLVHDLRAPVAVLKGSLDMFRPLLERGRVEEVERLLVSARQGVDRLLHLINELLDINRLENGRLPLRRGAVVVEPFLREVSGRLDPLTKPAGIAIELSVEPGLPPLDVDPELVARVVINLLDNAIRFTPDGGRIRLWARRPAPGEPPGLRLGVGDDGPGIAPPDQAHLFEKFHQVPSPNRRTGAGLGLAFCKLVVEAHGGCIAVQSEPGHGATFLVSLPMVAEGI